MYFAFTFAVFLSILCSPLLPGEITRIALRELLKKTDSEVI